MVIYLTSLPLNTLQFILPIYNKFEQDLQYTSNTYNLNYSPTKFIQKSHNQDKRVNMAIQQFMWHSFHYISLNIYYYTKWIVNYCFHSDVIRGICSLENFKHGIVLGRFRNLRMTQIILGSNKYNTGGGETYILNTYFTIFSMRQFYI